MDLPFQDRYIPTSFITLFGAAGAWQWDRRSGFVVFRLRELECRQGLKTTSHIGESPGPPGVFHEISRAAGPSQQTTKGDGLSHLNSVRAAGGWMEFSCLRDTWLRCAW